ncbi:cytochrome P450 [Dactylosporangium sucinum]|uniref:Cytochrome P450 n=1 Tax=Dactylosporangium sucinum TaxID=1424081 RepID=A0A917TWU8_9ACTN|nr:cytochrome P450 [Dactylosporangium sucinum]GGM40658.1 cytochrome P450 [Dactylosporangium sucinum]
MVTFAHWPKTATPVTGAGQRLVADGLVAGRSGGLVPHSVAVPHTPFPAGRPGYATTMTLDVTLPARQEQRAATRIGLLDTVRCAAGVLAPILAQGVIHRRDRVVRLAQRLDLNRRGARILHRLRARHGDGPLRLTLPGRSVVVVLDPADVERVLAGSPAPFALATSEKVAALRHFQPHGVLVSTGGIRAARRRYNDTVLDADAPMHRLADAITAVVRAEAARLAAAPELDWPAFDAMWQRIVRRIVLGTAARDDTRLTTELNRLRDAANWAYLRPRQEHLRGRFQRRVDAYVAAAEPGSLAGTMAGTPAAGGVDPAGQVPHWLFAFDAAGMTALRTLALLGSDPARRATAAGDAPPLYPFVRACVQDTARLWPTTLIVLRESTTATDWGGTTLRAGTTFMLPSSYHHRDETAMHNADAFDPEAWLSGAPRRSATIYPFSAGPGACPGRNLVLLSTTTLIAALLARFPDLRNPCPLIEPLPRTLDHAGLRLATRRAP